MRQVPGTANIIIANIIIANIIIIKYYNCKYYNRRYLGLQKTRDYHGTVEFKLGGKIKKLVEN